MDSVGSLSFDAPIALKGRWEDRADTFVTDEGQDLVSKHIVWLSISTELGGYLFKGTSTNADPLAVVGASEIQKVIEVPDLRNLSTERRSIL